MRKPVVKVSAKSREEETSCMTESASDVAFASREEDEADRDVIRLEVALYNMV